jgi:hypothetical protein
MKHWCNYTERESKRTQKIFVQMSLTHHNSAWTVLKLKEVLHDENSDLWWQVLRVTCM